MIPQIIHEDLEKVSVITERLATTNSQRSYSNNRKRTFELDVGDQVYLKISSMKGVEKFGLKGKWSMRFVGPYKILQRVDEVSYELSFLRI